MSARHKPEWRGSAHTMSTRQLGNLPYARDCSGWAAIGWRRMLAGALVAAVWLAALWLALVVTP